MRAFLRFLSSIGVRPPPPPPPPPPTIRDVAFRHWREERAVIERGLPADAMRAERRIFAAWQTKHRLADQGVAWRGYERKFWREYEGGAYAEREAKARAELAPLIVWTQQPPDGD